MALMLQSHSRDGVRLYQDPGVRLVVDGQVRGASPLGSWVGDAWDSVSDFIGDVGSAAASLPGAIYHSPSMLYDTAKLAAQQGCKVLTGDAVRSAANYCAAAVLVPGPQQAATVSACAAYAAAALACGLAFPQVPPMPQGTTNTGGGSAGTATQLTQAQILQKQNALLQMRSLTAQVAAAAATPPWYKRGSTYAVLGAAAAAVGGAYYFTRVRRR